MLAVSGNSLLSVFGLCKLQGIHVMYVIFKLDKIKIETVKDLNSWGRKRQKRWIDFNEREDKTIEHIICLQYGIIGYFYVFIHTVKFSYRYTIVL